MLKSIFLISMRLLCFLFIVFIVYRWWIDPSYMCGATVIAILIMIFAPFIIGLFVAFVAVIIVPIWALNIFILWTITGKWITAQYFKDYCTWLDRNVT